MKLLTLVCAIAALPRLVTAYEKIYGVNLGSWYVVYLLCIDLGVNIHIGSCLNLGCYRPVSLSCFGERFVLIRTLRMEGHGRRDV